METFTTSGKNFLLNGKPFRIISGAMHYFRTMPEAWSDRLAKMKACGLNTIETYIPWNMHEPKEGEYCFSGLCNLERFLNEAKKAGLYVILRLPPYI